MKLSEKNKTNIQDTLIKFYIDKGNYFDYCKEFELYYNDFYNSWSVCLTIKNELFKNVEIHCNLSFSTKKVLKKSIEICNR